MADLKLFCDDVGVPSPKPPELLDCRHFVASPERRNTSAFKRSFWSKTSRLNNCLQITRDSKCEVSEQETSTGTLGEYNTR